MTVVTTGTTGTSWDEPAGATPRGTVVLVPGRGETASSYQRLGRRFAADAYKVRLVPVDLSDLDASRAAIDAVLLDPALPSPKVLVGADSGATLVATSGARFAADAVVLAGLALPGSAGAASWDAEIAARSACPVHRSVIAADAGFGRGHLNDPLPWRSLDLRPVGPTLVLHGTADPITPAEAAVAPFLGVDEVRVRLVEGGLHDVLNDVSHRSVAATLVLFLESLRLGSELPPIVRAPDQLAGSLR